MKEIDGIVEAISISHMSPRVSQYRDAALPSVDFRPLSPRIVPGSTTAGGRNTFEVKDSGVPIQPVKIDDFDEETTRVAQPPQASSNRQLPAIEQPPEPGAPSGRPSLHRNDSRGSKSEKLRILIVEVGCHFA
jgi:hypothetical protein